METLYVELVKNDQFCIDLLFPTHYTLDFYSQFFIAYTCLKLKVWLIANIF